MIDKKKIQEAANHYIGHEPEIDEGWQLQYFEKEMSNLINKGIYKS